MSEAASDLYEANRGDAFREVEFMDISSINDDYSIDALVDALRPAYEERDLNRKASHLNSYETIRRHRGEGIRAYVNRYLRIEGQLLDCNIEVRTTYDAEARGYRLLSDGHLPHEGVRNVITAAGGSYHFNNFRDALMMIYPDSSPSPSLYDNTIGRELLTRGRDAAAAQRDDNNDKRTFQRNVPAKPWRPMHIVEHDVGHDEPVPDSDDE